MRQLPGLSGLAQEMDRLYDRYRPVNLHPAKTTYLAADVSFPRSFTNTGVPNDSTQPMTEAFNALEAQMKKNETLYRTDLFSYKLVAGKSFNDL